MTKTVTNGSYNSQQCAAGEKSAVGAVLKNKTWAPPPGLLSRVFLHTVDQFIVQSDEVADKRCGAQTRASTAR